MMVRSLLYIKNTSLSLSYSTRRGLSYDDFGQRSASSRNSPFVYLSPSILGLYTTLPDFCITFFIYFVFISLQVQEMNRKPCTQFIHSFSFCSSFPSPLIDWFPYWVATKVEPLLETYIKLSLSKSNQVRATLCNSISYCWLYETLRQFYCRADVTSYLRCFHSRKSFMYIFIELNEQMLEDRLRNANIYFL